MIPFSFCELPEVIEKFSQDISFFFLRCWNKSRLFLLSLEIWNFNVQNYCTYIGVLQKCEDNLKKRDLLKASWCWEEESLI